MTALDAFGWAGSALVIYSIMQSRVLRFRILNFAACTSMVIYNAILGVWPMVAMNVVLCAINVRFIVTLMRDGHSPEAYEVIPASGEDLYLARFLTQHAEDIATFEPEFRAGPVAGRQSFLVLKGDEIVGAVVLHDAGEGLAQIDLDYVTKRFRDFSPGEFVFRRSGLLRALGFSRVRTSESMADAYYPNIGFVRDGRAFVLRLGAEQEAGGYTA